MPDGQPLAPQAGGVRDDLPGTAERITRGAVGAWARRLRPLLHPWTDFERYAPNDPDPYNRAQSRALFADMLELAERIEAPGMTMLPGIDWPGMTHRESFDRAVEELGRRAEQASARGIRFSIEPHLGSIAQDPGEAPDACVS